MALFDQRVEVDHLLVVVEEVDDYLPCDVGRQGGDGGEARALEHIGR